MTETPVWPVSLFRLAAVAACLVALGMLGGTVARLLALQDRVLRLERQVGTLAAPRPMPRPGAAGSLARP